MAMEPEENQATHIELYPLLSSITAATDLVSRLLVDHLKKVSFVAYSLGKALSLDQHSLSRLTLAAAIHDIGGISIRARLTSFEFEVTDPDLHTLPGYFLLTGFAPFADLPESSASTIFTGRTAKVLKTGARKYPYSAISFILLTA